jgi:hypothetical protein
MMSLYCALHSHTVGPRRSPVGRSRDSTIPDVGTILKGRDWTSEALGRADWKIGMSSSNILLR